MGILGIIGSLILFAFLSFFSFILLPSLFGCFGFILFLFTFFVLIIYFSASIAWFILFVFICYLLLGIRKYFRYKKIPDYDTYLANNPNSYVNGKVYCNNCGSEHITHTGLFGSQSKLRYFMCMSCRKILYRFKVI